MSRRRSTSDHLAEHSLAKVEVLRYYVAAYLSVLERSEISEVHLLDLMCGEGVYKDGNRGSAFAIVDAVKDHFYSQEARNCVHVWLNDSGQSAIDESRSKIERVEEVCGPLVKQLPEHIHVHYSDREALDLAYETLAQLDDGAKRFVFLLDPHGYKEVHPRDLRRLLSSRTVEVILFVPASSMYRFLSPAQERDFAGAAPLQSILDELWPSESAEFESVQHFVFELVDRLERYVGGETFSTPFMLETRTGNTYALLFFTHKRRGLELMIEAKWAYDQERGEGHRRGMEQVSMFSPKMNDLRSDLLAFIAEASSGRTNLEVLDFVLRRGFLPKHANQILRPMQRSRTLIVEYEDGEGVPRSVYISRKSRYKHRVRMTLAEIPE